MDDKSTHQLRRQQIEALFLAAVELPADAQTQFIHASTEDDPSLRTQVLSLLQADRQSDSVIGELAEDWNVGALLRGDEPDDLTQVGEHYGNYRVTELIGSGGMGEVWRARRVDGRFDTEVAIKLLRTDQIDQASQARFHKEGQLLARLVHPNIARLLDAGVTTERRAYLVLELVQGVSIEKYCQTQQLSLTDRLLLFLDVLDAIAHAHANLVIHRDIKPANILVTHDGVVKLLDFGVAALLDERIGEPGITTTFGTAMTPEYAAPEQLLGESITTATDTFALGLVLHVLLAGWHPRTSRDSDKTREQEPYTLLRAIRHATDELPKVSAFPARSSIPPRVLVGDIDNIIAKAVAQDPAERYPTALALADDIRRHLRHEPVVAQAPTLTYRAAKFFRRHRGGVISACLVTLALITAVVVTSIQTLEANRARQVALDKQQQSQATQEFFSLMLEEMDNLPFTAVDLLDRGSEMLDQQYDTNQAHMGDVIYSLASRYGAIRERDQEIRMLQQSASIARRHNNKQLLAASLCSLATRHLETDADASARYATEGQQLFDTLRSPDLESTVACLRNRARQAEIARNFDEAADHVRTALARLDELPTTSIQVQGSLLNHLSHINFSRKSLLRSLELLEEVQALLGRNGRKNTLSYLRVVSNRAVVLSDMGRLKEAIDLQQTTIEALQSSGFASRGAAGFLEGYARSLARAGRAKESIPILEQGLALAVANGDEYNAANQHVGLARAAIATKDYVLAEEHLAEGERYFSTNPKAWPSELGSINTLRVIVLRKVGKLETARAKVTEMLAKTGYPQTSKVVSQLSLLIQATAVHQELGDFVEAEALATDVIKRLSQSVGNPATSVDVGRAHIHRAEIRDASGDHVGAQADLLKGLPIMRVELGSTAPEVLAAEALMQE